MYRIEKNIDDVGVERLPDITETILWDETAEEISVVGHLYMAIAKRENHYQDHTPPAFGDPDYVSYCSLANGILIGSGMKESLEDDKIIIRKEKRTIMVIDKIARNPEYKKAVEENHRLLKNLGL